MTARSMTLDTIKALSGEGSDSKDLLATLRKAGRDFETLTDKGQQEQGKAVAIAAMAAHLATLTGVLLPEGERESADRPGSYGASNYVKTFVGVKGDKPAVSPSNVPHWRTLGHMLAVVGVPVEHSKPGQDRSTWQLASQTPGTVLKDAVYADGATPESVREALLTVKHPDGSRIATGQQGGKGKPRQSKGEGEPIDVAADPVAAALAALVIVEAACKALPKDDRDGWARIESKMDEIRTREVTIRTAKPVRKATARKATARKAS